MSKNSDSGLVKINRALISVSDKSGVVELAQALQEFGVEIFSTGGTFKLLKSEGIPAIEVADYTGHPEMMDGRVKTLHPKIHGGILGRRGTDDDIMEQHGIKAIDMVVVNLYPFSQTVADPNCSLEDAIENIDIGGPTMVRAAAKNNKDVAIVVKPSAYSELISSMKEHDGCLSQQQRFDLAIQAYEHTAAYDGAIANYFGRLVPGGSEQFPRTFNMQFEKKQELRYGENPHQHSSFYVEPGIKEASISTAKQLHGKELSYNNIADTDAALEAVKQFSEPACVIVKHANPCGVAVASSILDAYELAFATDSESAFGGILAFNREFDETTAQAISQRGHFVEVIIAPSVSDAALAICAQKKNIRVLSCGQWQANQTALDYKRVNGGLLVQDRDLAVINESDLKVVSERKPTTAEISDLLFAWKVAKFVKSNAIVYAKNLQTIGVGAGQMSRVNSARIAAIKAEHAGLDVKNSVMASDAFFPFRDGIDNAASVGISCVIQPGGSMRDDEVISAANEHEMAMVFTGIRHFRH